MEADYQNWMPEGAARRLAAGAAALWSGAAALGRARRKLPAALCGAGALGLGAAAGWCVWAGGKYSYDGRRKLSMQIVEGVAELVSLPVGGAGLDVGCGSGALTIACAKRNPRGRMVGCDRWGGGYAGFSRELCERNAAAEGAGNVEFLPGDARKLPFADGSFDCVTSNYVYHNITGRDKQALLLETLRVLKKGGAFVIHDIMSRARYGDMDAFVQKLRGEGYAQVELIGTANGRFMDRAEAAALMLTGSALLVGRK